MHLLEAFTIRDYIRALEEAARMAGASEDLTDDQIEKLLAEAESRLATGGPQKGIVQLAKRSAPPSMAIAAPPRPATAKKTAEITIRVPRLAENKGRVRIAFLPLTTTSSTVFLMNAFLRDCNDAG
jgi:hypothetical protein